jgi:hypothetical protein
MVIALKIMQFHGTLDWAAFFKNLVHHVSLEVPTAVLLQIQVLRSDAMNTSTELLMFWRSLHPPSSELFRKSGSH